MSLSIRISVLLVFLCMLHVSVAPAETIRVAWTIVATSGAIEITDAAQHMVEAKAGMRLEPPLTIATGQDGRAVISHGQDRLTIGANSRIGIPQPSAEENGLLTRVRQTLGSVLYQVEHRIKDSFEVDTPYLVSVVKGTTFNIHVTLEDSTVALIEGKLWVHTPDLKSEVILRPGQAAIKSHSGNGILVKDQQALSSVQRGPITLANDGSGGTTVLRQDSGAGPSLGAGPVGRDKAPLTGDNLAVTAAGSAVLSTPAAIAGGAALDPQGDIGAASPSSKVGGVGLLDVETSVGNVSSTATVNGPSTSLSIGGSSALNLGTSLGNVSSTATIGGSSVLSVSGSAGSSSANLSIGGGSALSVGTTVGNTSVGATLGGNSLIELGAAVGGASTNVSVGGSSLVNVGTTTASSTPAGSTTTSTTTTSATASPSLTQVPVVGGTLGSVLKLGK